MREVWRSFWAVPVSLLLALLLSVFSLPDALRWLRPQWLALVCLYWCVLAPKRLPLPLLWCVGVVLDLLTGTPLGLHALALVVLFYFATKVIKQWRIHGPWAHLFMITVLSSLYEAVQLWGMQVLAGMPVSAWSCCSVITTVVLWMLVYPRDYRA